MAPPVRGCPSRSRDPARFTAPPLFEPPCEPGETDETREEPPDEPPELELELPRDEADPDLPLEDDEGVREPAGVWTRGGSDSRTLEGGLVGGEDPSPEPDDPEDPDEVGRGIACPAAAAGTASASARATTTNERGLLSMSMHSLNREDPTGWLLLQTLQQYCHQKACRISWKRAVRESAECPQSRPALPSGADGLTMPVPARLSRT